MYSSIIGKVRKARQYAAEKDRVNLSRFAASFRGEHDAYEITYEQGEWQCTCVHFRKDILCSHTMAVERMLEGIIFQQSAS